MFPLLFFFNILRKNWVINLIFCMQINIKVSYHLILTLLASKFLTRWYYQYWWVWSSILKVLKVTSFAISSQYLKKAVRDGFHFLHANKHQSFYKLVLSFSMEVARHVQSTQNRKLVMLFQYIKKNYHNSLCVLLWWTFRYFTGVQSCLLLLFLFLFIMISYGI